MRFAYLSLAASFTAVVVACGSDVLVPDDGTGAQPDGGSALDAGVATEAGNRDAGLPGDGGARDDGGVAGDAGDGDAGPCVSHDFVTSPLLEGETLVDVAAGKAGGWILTRTTTAASQLAVRSVGGPRVVLETAGATGAAIAARPDGEVCVLWGVGMTPNASQVKTACSPSFAVVDTTLTTTIAKFRPVSYRDDGAAGAAVLFDPSPVVVAGDHRVAGLLRPGNGAWRDAQIVEPAIPQGGGPRALGGTAVGAPYCFAANGAISVKGWQQGAASEIATLSGRTYEACGVATSNGAVAILARGDTGLAFALRVGAAPPGPEALLAQAVRGFGLAATPTDFVLAFIANVSVRRGTVPVTGGAPVFRTLPVPAGTGALTGLALAIDPARTEYLALQAAGGVLVSKTCAP